MKRIVLVLTELEIITNPHQYQKTIQYLKGKLPCLIVTVERKGVNGHSDIVEVDTSMETLSETTLYESLSPSPISLINGDNIDAIIVSVNHRIPDFDLFHSAYAEYVFTKKPVLYCSKRRILRMILKACNRDRRFGK